MIAALIPPGAHRITIFPGYPIGNRESKWRGDFFSLYFSVHCTSNDIDTFFSERSTAFLKACKQATTKGSPMASIKKNDSKRRLQIFRQVDSISACYL
jgi:hypothetical protein